MFLLPLPGVSSQVRTGGQRAVWGFVIVLFGLLVGFRFWVGGDWYNYLQRFELILYYSFSEILSRDDPAYYVLNWLVADAGWSIVWVNAACSIFIMAGVHSFCRNQPLPWLALLVAVPYMIVVVCMGYSRQATALGFVLIGLTALGKQQTRQFMLWVLIGALFHKTAVLMLPIAALAATKNRVWTFIWASVVAASGAYFLIFDYSEALWDNYVENEYAFASQGAQIRVFMNAVPSVLLLLFRKRIFYDTAERKLWLWLSFFSLTCIMGLGISPTAIDRIALYFIPIQIFAFSRLPYLTRDRANFSLIVAAVVAYYALVQFVWLNFATHARFWLPYQNFIFI